jgi:hypothetical protein
MCLVFMFYKSQLCNKSKVINMYSYWNTNIYNMVLQQQALIINLLAYLN